MDDYSGFILAWRKLLPPARIALVPLSMAISLVCGRPSTTLVLSCQSLLSLPAQPLRRSPRRGGSPPQLPEGSDTAGQRLPARCEREPTVDCSKLSCGNIIAGNLQPQSQDRMTVAVSRCSLRRLPLEIYHSSQANSRMPAIMPPPSHQLIHTKLKNPPLKSPICTT